ncbi:hypothetical protein B1H42_02525 [Enterobacter cloacae subsp. cloacae]|uniref:Uncharacterized protein n=1 Tax=Enterobacter cloacae subsp. cloacae (strain ATCC 13047 / DSM 30054 / NBRC 13535 / NCTC 10005 / WDCM 00083 / NCDC 279-56) TaxID=716541 RepID=A0A0H3CH07_ENTCC|nr:hypothetical protein ECL_01605 [Enterobacter cloacae subsp. cloacae ATCC 13047]AIV30217.1 hypothetical protein EC036_25700 [Enterobacter cloacae]ORC24082.1 hypothetical protein B1H42_02525 [Enterobacter cloacae subsp. cloacae]ORC30650.1 hypothetical protein B2M05_13320 [Enterobacter cloacae subsp. cloacae]
MPSYNLPSLRNHALTLYTSATACFLATSVIHLPGIIYWSFCQQLNNDKQFAGQLQYNGSSTA